MLKAPKYRLRSSSGSGVSRSSRSIMSLATNDASTSANPGTFTFDLAENRYAIARSDRTRRLPPAPKLAAKPLCFSSACTIVPTSGMIGCSSCS